MHLCCKMILPQNLNCVTGSKRTKCALQYASHWALLKEKLNFFEDKMPPGKSPTRILPPEPTTEKVDFTYFFRLSWFEGRIWRTLVWLLFAKITSPRGTRKTTAFRIAKNNISNQLSLDEQIILLSLINFGTKQYEKDLYYDDVLKD